jgi:Protein of unknown function (DUF3485)
MTMRFLYSASALAAVLASGVIHGLWTDRWQTASEPAARGARLPVVPFVLGEWVGQDIDTDLQQVGPMTGFLHRRYLNRQTGAGVTVYMVCGRPGPVCIHTPDICYKATGYEFLSQERFHLPVELDEGEFWVADLRKTNSTEDRRLRIFWAWSSGGSWSVPENPRLAFARESALFKLYLIREASEKLEPLADDPCLDLMKQLLPEWRKTVFQGS